jgi:hypothetical protein
MTLKLTSPTGRAALAYVVRFGWRVFPIKPGTKQPQPRFVRHGHKNATCDPEQVRRWWGAEPDCGIGIAAKVGGLVVIDADLYKDDCVFSALEGELGPLPETPRVLTPQGGCHFYFRAEVGEYAGIAGCGVDVKSEGYVLAPPSVHPNGGLYRWDVGAHVLDTPLAALPDAWLRHLTSPRIDKALVTALPSSGVDAADSWLGHAFAADGALGGLLDGGKRAVRCPWLHEHSDGRGNAADSSTILFPRATGRTLGGFRCAHAHCEGRTWSDVVAVLSPTAKWVADQAMRRERNRLALEYLAARRRAG